MSAPASGELIYAVRFSGIEKVKELLARGAKVNETDRTENTPLMYAAGREGNLELLRLLIDKGALINEKNRYGNTALMQCVDWAQDAEMVRFLLGKGARLDITNKSGYTAQGIAENKGTSEIARILKEAAEIHRKIAEEKVKGDAALALAAERQRLIKTKIRAQIRPR